MTGRRPPRVALVSVGLGRVRRGFERYFSDLFGVLRDELDITMFCSATESPGQRVPTGLRAATVAARALPLGRLAGQAEYNRDCLAFGLTLLPQVAPQRFDVVHCIDPPLAFVLQRFRQLGLLRARLLFTEGCFMPPALYPSVDRLHHVGQAAYDAATLAGVPRSRMTLVPCGLHVERFRGIRDRAEIRARFQIPPDTFLVLAVSAVKRDHKRIDHLIEEVAQLPGDVMLWVDGHPEDSAVEELAQRQLGPRCRITHVPSVAVPDLYHAADVFVHASLSESFGLSIVEAQSSGCPVLVHESAHFSWLVEDPRCLTDMKTRGRLAARLQQFRQEPPRRPDCAILRTARIQERFDWRVLTPAYLDMYAQTAALPVRPSVHAPAMAETEEQ